VNIVSVIIIWDKFTNKVDDVVEIESLSISDMYSIYAIKPSEKFPDIELFEEDFKFLSNYVEGKMPITVDFFKYRYYIGLCSKDDLNL
jgi:hypothetical protein